MEFRSLLVDFHSTNWVSCHDSSTIEFVSTCSQWSAMTLPFSAHLQITDPARLFVPKNFLLPEPPENSSTAREPYTHRIPAALQCLRVDNNRNWSFSSSATPGVILTGAVFQAQGRISRLTGLERQRNGATIHKICANRNTCTEKTPPTTELTLGSTLCATENSHHPRDQNSRATVEEQRFSAA
jgi:hypothetical protein